jgi:nondiscriminating glutamyl-tRNA synthetase
MSDPRPGAVRVRFAPSPTGDLHLGNARTALYNWLFARRHGGVLVLRIEDTDLERSSASSEEGILDDLKWLGLDWDEGPDLGGPFGPYRQTKRLRTYQEKTAELLEKGLAYRCFCTPDTIEKKRVKALAEGRTPRYDGTCRSLPPEEAAAREAAGEQPSIRFTVPQVPIVFDDMIRGELTFGEEAFGDLVIVRSNGVPSYNFAVVIDDHLMGISHVIRGEDHISNTPRQIQLYRAFGWEPPRFAHLPMILGADRTRLSKRHGATSVSHFRQAGFLPGALANYLALLGWSPSDGREVLSLTELTGLFQLDRVNTSNAMFDVAKLEWINGQYIRACGIEKLTTLVIPALKQAELLSGEVDQETFAWLQKVVEMVRPSLKTLADLPQAAAVAFGTLPASVAPEAVELLAKPGARGILAEFRRRFAEASALDVDSYHAIAASAKETLGVGGKALFSTLRAGLTGRTSGPELAQLILILGKQRLLARLDDTLSRIPAEG